MWDKTSEEFKDRELKSKLWLEVCSFLEPNFLQLDRKEQIKVGKYLLTPWSRVLLEKLASLQLVKKFPAFYGTRRFLTALTSARDLSLS